MGNNAEMKEQGFSEVTCEKTEVSIVQCEGQNPENSEFKQLM